MKTSLSKFAFFALVIGLFLTLNRTTSAQSTLDDFNPSANDEILTMTVQPDGRFWSAAIFVALLPDKFRLAGSSAIILPD
jgi:hypothetical protein